MLVRTSPQRRRREHQQQKTHTRAPLSHYATRYYGGVYAHAHSPCSRLLTQHASPSRDDHPCCCSNRRSRCHCGSHSQTKSHHHRHSCRGSHHHFDHHHCPRAQRSPSSFSSSSSASSACSSRRSRPVFAAAARRLVGAIDNAVRFYDALLAAHAQDTAAVSKYAGSRVLDALWRSRLRWGGALDAGGVEGGGDGKDGSGSVREQWEEVTKALGRAVVRAATARVDRGVGDTEGMGKWEEERRIRDRVRGVEEVFGVWRRDAVERVSKTRQMVIELGLLKVVLERVVKSD